MGWTSSSQTTAETSIWQEELVITNNMVVERLQLRGSFHPRLYRKYALDAAQHTRES